jgi:hypothetical protein
VAIATRKGSGLVDALTVATNGLIADGSYTRSLMRWAFSRKRWAARKAIHLDCRSSDAFGCALLIKQRRI